jgi:hypothetical protein
MIGTPNFKLCCQLIFRQNYSEEEIPYLSMQRYKVYALFIGTESTGTVKGNSSTGATRLVTNCYKNRLTDLTEWTMDEIDDGGPR